MTPFPGRTLRAARAVAVTGALAALAAALLAGHPAAQEPKSGQPVFRTEAELVIVDAVVLDPEGRPVTDLRQSDFEILDEGDPQQIRLFQTISTAPAASIAAPGAPRRYPYSTNVGLDARPTRAFVLFFDDVHLTQAEGDRAKAAMTRFIDTELRDGDLVSLVAPGRALRWHARMPEGRAELARIVASLRGAFLPDLSSERMSDYEAYRIHVFSDEAVAEQVDRRWKNFRVLGREPTDLSSDPGFRPENRGGNIGIIRQDIAIRAAAVYGQAAARNRATLLSLERTLEGLAAVRGRKSVVLLSPGFIEDQERRESRQVIAAARRSNVALYFVDARGLVGGSPFGQAQFGSPLDSRDVGAAQADITLGAEGAETLSAQTGGFSVRNQNDLGSALERISRESQVYYMLGYQPKEPGRPGSFRRLQVKVRRPDVEVRARRGYFVGSPDRDPADRSAAGLTDELERATDSPYELSAIPVRTAAYVFGDAGDGKAVALIAVEADLRAFQFEPREGRLVDILDLRMATTHQDTGLTERYERQVEMTFPLATRFSADAWHNLAQEFNLAPGRYQARVAVRDRASGRIGAVTHDFEVPALEGLRITTPILTDTIDAPAFGSQAPPKPVLIVRRAFPSGTTLYYQFSVLGAGRAPATPPRVVASHEIWRADGALVRRMDPRPIAAAGEGGLSRLSGLSLAGLEAGDYELRLQVTDEVRGETIERREPFAILPPERGVAVGQKHDR